MAEITTQEVNALGVAIGKNTNILNDYSTTVDKSTKIHNDFRQSTKVMADTCNMAVESFSLFSIGLRGSGKALEEIRKILDIVVKNLDNFGPAIASIGQGVGDGMANAGKGLESLGGSTGQALKDVGAGFAGMGGGLKDFGGGLSGVGGGIKDIGGGLGSFASGLGDSSTAMAGLGTALPAAAKGFMEMCVALDGVTAYIPQIAIFGAALYGLSKIGADLVPAGEALKSIGEGMATVAAAIGTFATGLNSTAAAIALLIPLLPALGTSMLEMAINMSGVLAYLPELLVFLGIMLVLSLLGEGLLAAGTGLLNIGLGLTSMTEGMAALLTFMPIFIESLAGITSNVGGIILFVLLAAAMLVMAIAMEKINEQMVAFVESMTALNGLMSVGFVACFAVFAVMLVLMSCFMEKVASGMQKVTDAMKKQCVQLAILNPLLAVKAVLENWIMGAVTVGLAIASGLIVRALFPGMATGGVVSSPTVAMVGEGRYPEAVVPLGDSPQFASMKADIANAVLTAINATGGGVGKSGGAPIELTVRLDSRVVAKEIYSPLQIEAARRGN